jgi:hypothetical protein
MIQNEEKMNRLEQEKGVEKECWKLGKRRSDGCTFI